LPDPIRFYASLAGNIALTLIILSILGLLLKNHCQKRRRRQRSGQPQRAANDLDFFSISGNDDHDETSPLLQEIDAALMKSDPNLAAEASKKNKKDSKGKIKKTTNDPQPSTSNATSTSGANEDDGLETINTQDSPVITPSTSATMQCTILNALIETNNEQKKSRFETIRLKRIFKKN
jgi:hypothetical protein